MQETKSLIESRAFWSAALALMASVAESFHLAGLGAWASDPGALDQIMNAVAVFGSICAILFRFQATARTTTVLPPGAGPGATSAVALLCALPLVGAIAGCSQTQLASYTKAAQATSGVLLQVGGDLARFDCQYGALIQVVAQDVNAARRVQAALQKNASLIHDACPALTGTPAVSVVAGG